MKWELYCPKCNKILLKAVSRDYATIQNQIYGDRLYFNKLLGDHLKEGCEKGNINVI